MADDLEKVGEDQRLQRIKFLVEQSKLYTQFLTSTLSPNEKAKSENEPLANEGASREDSAREDPEPNNNDSHSTQRGSDSGKPAPKRRKAAQGRASKGKPNGTPAITSFFKPPPAKTSEQPRSIAVPLHAYQVDALKWLTMLYQNGLNGILADEMGLGKTLEVIAFLAFLIENEVQGPFLVLAPLSTLGNWCNEIHRFAPSLTFTKYYGSKQQRTALRRKKATWGQIVVSSYEVVLADSAYLQKINWRYIIVDEGHRLKNVDSKLTKALKRFSSANRMLLTGTPLQNNLTELWALLNFLLPDIFTDLEIFHSWFESGEAHIGEKDETSLVTSLHDILRPFLLRRLKKDVGLNLPPKREYVVFAGLTRVQQDLYRAFLEGSAREYVTRQILAEYEDSGSSSDLVKQAQQEVRTKSFSNLMMQLRLCCNSPHLFWYPYDASTRIESDSGKLQLLHQLTQRLKAQGHKILVFTQFTRMLDLLEDWASIRNYSYCRLDGSTPQEERQSLIDKFSDPDSAVDLFFLTTRSGGQGINLVGADTVILFDSDWNPQQDLQAMDRVHRIGQDQPVLVLRLCMGDTVEQELLEHAATKLELNHLVIESGHFKGPSITKGTNEEKIESFGRQLSKHKVKFETGAIAQISASDMDCMLDRSTGAYVQAISEPKISDSIICIKSQL